MSAAAGDEDAPGNTLGANLRRRREALRLTAAQFAAAIGCSRETLCHAETGRRSRPASGGGAPTR